MRKKNKVPQSWNLSKEPIPGRIWLMGYYYSRSGPLPSVNSSDCNQLVTLFEDDIWRYFCDLSIFFGATAALTPAQKFRRVKKYIYPELGFRGHPKVRLDMCLSRIWEKLNMCWIWEPVYSAIYSVLLTSIEKTWPLDSPQDADDATRAVKKNI
jgi:hypothetical protein